MKSDLYGSVFWYSFLTETYLYLNKQDVTMGINFILYECLFLFSLYLCCHSTPENPKFISTVLSDKWSIISYNVFKLPVVTMSLSAVSESNPASYENIFCCISVYKMGDSVFLIQIGISK